MANTFFNKYYNKLEDNIKPSSLKTYYFWFKKINDDFDIKIFTNLELVKTKLVDDTKLLSKVIISLIRIFKILKVKESIIKKFNDYYKTIKPNIEIKEAKEEDKNNVLSVDDIIKIKEKYKEQYADKPNLKNALSLLVLYLYTEIPPLRSQDYINTSFDFTETPNFISIKDKALFIREGKRTNINNARKINLNTNIIKAISNVKKEVEKLGFKNKWLIPKIYDPNTNMKNDTFSKFLNSIFGKGISSSKLRNIYASHYTDTGINAEERQEKADIMGHTVSTNLLTYNKFSKRLHGKLEDLPEVKELFNKLKELEKENTKLNTMIKELCNEVNN